MRSGWIVVAALVGLAGCSGEVASKGDAGKGGDGGAARDATHGSPGEEAGTALDAASPVDASADAPATTLPVCPEVEPVAGAPCTTTGVACAIDTGIDASTMCATECSYGNDPIYDCRPDFYCVGGVWTLDKSALDPTYPCAPAPKGACPATLAAANNVECPVQGVVCDYGNTTCICTECTGGCPEGPDGGLLVTWTCDLPPTPASCPAKVPNLGTPCTSAGLDCTFGNCYSGTWMEVVCTGGIWQRPLNVGCAT